MLRLLASFVLFLVLGSSLCAHEQDIPARDLRILSWNIYMLPGIVPMKGRLERAQAIVDTLLHSNYDIIVFQEAFHRKAVAKIDAGLRDKFPYRYGPFNMPKNIFSISSGVWIVSKVKLEVLGVIEFRDEADNDRLARKGAALLQGEYNGKKFQLLGTHMQANENRQSIRSKQFQQMYVELLSPYKQEGVPQLLCGDMNTEAAIKKEYSEMLSRLDAENGDYEGIQKDTYDGTKNMLAEAAWKRASTTLDYILLRRNGAKITSIKRSVSVLKRKWRKGYNDLSDHYGVVCELRF